MSHPAGYEELPEGTEPFLPRPAQQAGPTITEAGAPSSGAVLGVPAYAQQQPQPQLEQLPPFPQYLGQLPTAEAEWERSTLLFSVWLGCSGATLALALLTLNPLATAGAACATVGAATHRFAGMRKNQTLADSIERILRLAIAAACLLAVVAFTCVLIAIGLSASCSSAHDKKACAELVEITTFYGVWYSLITAVTLGALRSAARMKRLLNPVSSGAVSI